MSPSRAFLGMIGESRAQKQLVELVQRAAPGLRTALITGETGTGKELVARALHALGPRAGRPLIVVSCAMLAPDQAFSHSANGATLFLDEIADMPMPVQAQLLHALEHGEVLWGDQMDESPIDLVAIASTNRDLSAEASMGRFRRDLYYRLGVVHLPVAPLRERRDDIPLLTSNFLSEFNGSIRRVRGITGSAERLLSRVTWPGNVRELRNVLQRACIRTEEDVLSERTVATAMLSPQVQAVAYRHSVRSVGAAAG